MFFLALGVSYGVTWWSTAHSKLLSHLLSTRRSRQGRRTPALPPRNASLPEALDLYPGSGTSPCPLYPRSSCFVLWAALRSHTMDRHLYLLTHCYNQSLPSVLLLFLRSAGCSDLVLAPPGDPAAERRAVNLQLIYIISTQELLVQIQNLLGRLQDLEFFVFNVM